MDHYVNKYIYVYYELNCFIKNNKNCQCLEAYAKINLKQNGITIIVTCCISSINLMCPTSVFNRDSIMLLSIIEDLIHNPVPKL